MNAIPPRIISAGAILLGLVTAVSASDLTFSEFESRLIRLESQLAAEDEIVPATYNCDACCDSGCCYEASCSDCNCCDAACCSDCCGCADCCCGSTGGCYAEVQFNFFRAHVLEGAIITDSKLSEEYELSPRFIVGYENCHGDGGRVRYWHHGHQHDNIAGPSGIRFEWDVFDAEFTKHFTHGRHDVILAAGVRLADTNVRYTIWDAHANLIGGEWSLGFSQEAQHFVGARWQTRIRCSIARMKRRCHRRMVPLLRRFFDHGELLVA